MGAAPGLTPQGSCEGSVEQHLAHSRCWLLLPCHNVVQCTLRATHEPATSLPASWGPHTGSLGQHRVRWVCHRPGSCKENSYTLVDLSFTPRKFWTKTSQEETRGGVGEGGKGGRAGVHRVSHLVCEVRPLGKTSDGGSGGTSSLLPSHPEETSHLPWLPPGHTGLLLGAPSRQEPVREGRGPMCCLELLLPTWEWQPMPQTLWLCTITQHRIIPQTWKTRMEPKKSVK